MAQTLPPNSKWLGTPKRNTDGQISVDGSPAQPTGPASQNLASRDTKHDAGDNGAGSHRRLGHQYPPKGCITVTNRSSSDLRNYPLQLARPFAAGEMTGAPQMVVNGIPIPTQADVKLRYADGSIKHAILSALIPRLQANQAVTISFQSQARNDNTPLQPAEMLSPEFDFDAVIEAENQDFAKGDLKRISAREMLRTAKVCADDVTTQVTSLCSYWTKGPIATTIILADHAESHAFDFGFTTAQRPVRQVYHVTFWPGIHKVKVRFIGEISNPAAMQDEFYDFTLKTGFKSPETVYSKRNWAHHFATRWTRTFWIGGTPEQNIDIDENLPDLSRTRLVANYDPQQGGGSDYFIQLWRNKSHDVGDHGIWQVSMPTTGDRADIGHYPGWNIAWLYDGSAEIRDIALSQADLSANWPLQVRENKNGAITDADRTYVAKGRTVTAYTRPTLWIFDSRGTPSAVDQIPILSAKNFSMLDASNKAEIKPTRNHYELVAEQISPPAHSRYTWTDSRYQRFSKSFFDGWMADGAHQPDPFSIPYLLTGDYWYLEELQMWAGAGSLSYCVAAPWCRGPAGYAGIQDQTRGNAWMLRNRVNAAVLTPDSSPEKYFFSKMVNDALLLWEGAFNITRSGHQSQPMWKWGREVSRHGQLPSPLHFFDVQNVTPAYADLALANSTDSIAVGAASSPWMQNYFILELGEAADRGFDTTALIEWTGENLIAQLTDPDFNPYLASSYHMPVSKQDGSYFTNWKELLQGFQPKDRKVNTLRSDLTYTCIAYAATSHLVGFPKGAAARERLINTVGNRMPELQAKWAIVPRFVNDQAGATKGSP